jgi:hypothetical protein
MRLALVMSVFLAATVLTSPGASADEHGAVTVPLEIRGNFPVIRARIDGRELPLMYDLGGDSALVLTDEALAMVRTLPVEGTYRFSDAKGNIIETPLFKVSAIEIGDALFTDVTGRADRSDPSYQRTDIGDMGMLGLPFFQSWKLVLDYPQRRMTMIPKDHPAPEAAGCRGSPVPFLPAWEGAPVTTVDTDVGELTVVWDTGAPVSLIRKQSAARGGANLAESILRSKRFALGGEDFGPLELRLFDYQEPQGTDGFVGYSFFATHVVCIDFPGQRLLVRMP